MPDSAVFVGPLDRVLSLKSLPMLEALSSRQLVAIAQRTRERFIGRGSALLRRGEIPTAHYLVLQGRLESVSEDGSRSLERGDTVGLLEVLAREPLSSEVRAGVDTLVLELDADDQEDIWEDQFFIMLESIKYLARQVLTAAPRRSPVSTGVKRSSPVASFRSPLNLVERILTLQHIPMLASESIDAVAELSGHLSEIAIERGGQLWRHGDGPEQFWIVLSGTARLQTSGHSLDVGPGSCVGLEEALAGGPHSSDCRAEEPLLTLRIAREPFMDVLEDHFSLARELMTRMAARLRAPGALDAAS